MIYTRHITLDLYDDRIAEVEAQQGDTARALEITVTADGEQLIPAKGTRVNFRGCKPDGYGIDNPATITEQNTVLYKFTEQTVACPGRFPCDVYFVQDDGTLSTVTFWLIVKPHPDGKPGTSSHEYGSLVDATNKALEAASGATGAAGDARAATEAANKAASAANTAAGKANTAASGADTAAGKANTAAAGADASAKKADTAAAGADTAAGKANTAAAGADASAKKADTAAAGANAAAGRVDDAIAEADAATDEALDAAEQARQAAQSVIEQIDGVIVLNMDTGEKNIARFRVKDGHPAILEAELN